VTRIKRIASNIAAALKTQLTSTRLNCVMTWTTNDQIIHRLTADCWMLGDCHLVMDMELTLAGQKLTASFALEPGLGLGNASFSFPLIATMEATGAAHVNVNAWLGLRRPTRLR
jgi:hypothetical protein